jgi:hypothetical protein
MLASLLTPHAPDIIVALPTLGLAIAPVVAEALGHTRYVPMGYSVKFWYDDELSTPVSSIASPTLGAKRLYLDPNLVPLLIGDIDDTSTPTGKREEDSAGRRCDIQRNEYRSGSKDAGGEGGCECGCYRRNDETGREVADGDE